MAATRVGRASHGQLPIRDDAVELGDGAAWRTPGFLLTYAVLFPFIHHTLYSMRLLDEASRAGRVVVVLFGLVALVTLAGIHQWMLERRNRDLMRRITALTSSENPGHLQRLESLGVLAGGVAHDFNNLLTTVLGNAGIAQTKVGDPAGVRESLRGIEAAVRQAKQLTDQMLFYAGKTPLFASRVDLNPLIEQISGLHGDVVAKTARFESHLGADLPPIEGAPDRIRRIVVNLLTTASEALEGGAGLVTVRTGVGRGLNGAMVDYAGGSEDRDSVFLEVTDTGCGTDEQTRRRMFDPFFTTKFIGRGLGLAAVLGIVRSHGGAISVETRLGRGTTIRVLFPIEARDSAGRSRIDPTSAANAMLTAHARRDR